MPQLGEIKFGRDIGKPPPGSHRYMRTICIDCGKEKWTYLRKGKPDALRCNSCANRLANLGRRRELSPKWNGGIRTIDGYVVVALEPDDMFYPMCTQNGYVRQHRLVMAKSLGRVLYSWEVIHHINGDKADNRLENLKLLPSANEHLCFLLAQKKITRLEKRIQLLKGEIHTLKTELKSLRRWHENPSLSDSVE